tara:strand:- start:2062 stop:3387 length:1326 start_codon:yes stop_codon:yes gene_type:complete
MAYTIHDHYAIFRDSVRRTAFDQGLKPLEDSVNFDSLGPMIDSVLAEENYPDLITRICGGLGNLNYQGEKIARLCNEHLDDPATLYKILYCGFSMIGQGVKHENRELLNFYNYLKSRNVRSFDIEKIDSVFLAEQDRSREFLYFSGDALTHRVQCAEIEEIVAVGMTPEFLFYEALAEFLHVPKEKNSFILKHWVEDPFAQEIYDFVRAHRLEIEDRCFDDGDSLFNICLRDSPVRVLTFFLSTFRDIYPGIQNLVMDDYFLSQKKDCSFDQDLYDEKLSIIDMSREEQRERFYPRTKEIFWDLLHSFFKGRIPLVRRLQWVSNILRRSKENEPLELTTEKFERYYQKLTEDDVAEFLEDVVGIEGIVRSGLYESVFLPRVFQMVAKPKTFQELLEQREEWLGLLKDQDFLDRLLGFKEYEDAWSFFANQINVLYWDRRTN